MDLFEIPITRIPVVNSDDTFPVHRVYCIGRNYVDHVRELGDEPDRAPPVFFLKPPDSLVPGGGDIAYPPGTSNLHHEIELVVALDKGGRDIPAEAVRDHVFGYAVGIDLTRRDLQAASKKTGAPWDTAKSFEQAGPITPIYPAAEIGHPAEGRIWLAVNGNTRQEANLADMIWKADEAISDLSKLFTLQPGDLLFTGTPAGVGAVDRGDHVTGGIDGLAEIDIRIV